MNRLVKGEKFMKIHIFYVFSAFFCVFLIIFTIFLFFGQFSLGVVQSSSMAPTLQKGELIVFSAQAEYKTGDIVCYIDDSRLTAHRITLINGDLVITQGDNSATTSTLPTSKILGKVILNSAFLGQILAFFQHFWGIFVIFLIILIIFYFYKRKTTSKNRCSK